MMQRSKARNSQTRPIKRSGWSKLNTSQIFSEPGLRGDLAILSNNCTASSPSLQRDSLQEPRLHLNVRACHKCDGEIRSYTKKEKRTKPWPTPFKQYSQ